MFYVTFCLELDLLFLISGFESALTVSWVPHIQLDGAGLRVSGELVHVPEFLVSGCLSKKPKNIYILLFEKTIIILTLTTFYVFNNDWILLLISLKNKFYLFSTMSYEFLQIIVYKLH